MIPPDEITRRLHAALPGSRVTIEDLTGGGDHYRVRVVSESFAGKTLIERHRMVYAPLKDVLGGELHALSLDTRTPDEAGKEAP